LTSRLRKTPAQSASARPFSYRDGRLWCDDVSLEELARQHGTPLYVYSAGQIRERLRLFQEAFSSTPSTVCFAVKSNSSLAILRLLAESGTDLAIASLDASVAGLSVGVPPDLTAVTRVYDSWLQLFVPSESKLTSLSDLDGRVVAAGAAGSGTRFTVERLLGIAGLHPRLIDADQSQGAQMLACGLSGTLI